MRLLYILLRILCTILLLIYSYYLFRRKSTRHIAIPVIINYSTLVYSCVQFFLYTLTIHSYCLSRLKAN